MKMSIKEGWSSALQVLSSLSSFLKAGEVLLLPPAHQGLDTCYTLQSTPNALGEEFWALGSAAPCWTQPLKRISYMHRTLLQKQSQKQKQRLPGAPAGRCDAGAQQNRHAALR